MNRVISTFFSYAGNPGRSEMELIETFVARVSSLDPSLTVIVTTDPESARFLTHLKAELNVFSISRETLLLDRCKSNLELLKRLRGSRQVLFLDYDIAINRLVDADDHESLLLTVRGTKKYPINGGFLAFSRPDKASISLYQAVLDQYLACPKDNLRWWGDQVSLFQALSAYRESLFRLESFEHLGVLIQPVPTDECNWTPFDMDVSPQTLWQNFFLSKRSAAEYNQRSVIHFKGPRKHLMMQYARSNYGKNLSALPDWIGIEDSSDCYDLISGLYRRITNFSVSNDSIWNLADETFSFLPLLKGRPRVSVDTKVMLSDSLAALSRIHSDFRFRLVFGEHYESHTV